MPAVTKEEAVARLTKAVEGEFGADELLEIHNELFPDNRYSEEEAYADMTPLVKRLVDYLNGGRMVEEIVELWGLFFTRHRNIWYDEEEGLIHYDEEVEPVATE